MRLSKDFFRRDVLEVAPLLIGKVIVRKLEDGTELRGRITETEAYRGIEDTACHARMGKTKRNAVMFGDGGAAYVYLCYGIHNLLNIVTGTMGDPQAVLIRCTQENNGPGKLTKALQIDRSFNGVDVTESDVIYIEDDGMEAEYTTAPRVGIDYASKEDRERLWRYIKK